MVEGSQASLQTTGDLRCPEIKSFQQERHNIALMVQRSLNLASQPVSRVVTTLQRRRRQKNKKMCFCRDIAENDPLEVATGDTFEIKEHVISVVSQILTNGERPRTVGPPVTQKNGFLNAFHTLPTRN